MSLMASWDCVCFWLNPLFVHVNIYWQPALITCQSHSFLLQGPVTQKERWHMYVCHHLFLLRHLIQWGADSSRCRYLISHFSHWHRIGHRLCSLCQTIQRGVFLFIIFLQQKPKQTDAVPHKCSPPLTRNTMSPPFNIWFKCPFFLVTPISKGLKTL